MRVVDAKLVLVEDGVPEDAEVVVDVLLRPHRPLLLALSRQQHPLALAAVVGVGLLPVR